MASADVERLERVGFGAIRPAAGTRILSAVVSSLLNGRLAPQVAASKFIWERYAFKIKQYLSLCMSYDTCDFSCMST